MAGPLKNDSRAIVATNTALLIGEPPATDIVLPRYATFWLTATSGHDG